MTSRCPHYSKRCNSLYNHQVASNLNKHFNNATLNLSTHISKYITIIIPNLIVMNIKKLIYICSILFDSLTHLNMTLEGPQLRHGYWSSQTNHRVRSRLINLIRLIKKHFFSIMRKSGFCVNKVSRYLINQSVSMLHHNVYIARP